MNVRIIGVRAMECMCVQTTLRFILSSQRGFFFFLGGGGDGVRIHVNSKGEIPHLPEKVSQEENQTHDAASSRTSSPTHYQRTIPATGRGGGGDVRDSRGMFTVGTCSRVEVKGMRVGGRGGERIEEGRGG